MTDLAITDEALPPALLVVDDVRIQHEGREQFTPSGVTFTVRRGEVVLLLGPSGSGKSTLALALNGLIPQAVSATMSGTIDVVGHSTVTTPVPLLSAHVAMVFQDPDAQQVTGTLLDEVCFGPENLSLGTSEILDRAEQALRHVGLWERRGENPDRLSGGGRQRLAIASALAMRAPLLVLDEPTANLDPVGIEEVYAVLGDLAASHDHGIVLVEHNLDAAMSIVTRVIVLDTAGRVVADGPMRTILDERSAELMALGVWLPVSTLAGLRLREAGMPVPVLPLTPGELVSVIDASGEHPVARAEIASTEASDAVIQVRALTITRQRTRILDDVSLTVGRGDFLAIVGPNGAGKTTLLQAIAGVIPPPRGSVSIGGIDPTRAGVRELSAAIGFVFQNPEHQFIRGTVAEELAHSLELRGVDRTEIEHRVDAMLGRFGLSGLRDVHPFLLSGGQKRRLSVGTALIAGAPILALDEPTFGQDRERAAELLDILRQLNDEDTTVLVVTHDLQLVSDHASHIAVIADGRLIAHDTTANVLGGDAIDAAGLRLPPLARAMRATRDPAWHSITRLAELPLGVRP